MALVTFRVAGAAADQSAGERMFQIGDLTLRLLQDPGRGGASLKPTSRPAGSGGVGDAGPDCELLPDSPPPSSNGSAPRRARSPVPPASSTCTVHTSAAGSRSAEAAGDAAIAAAAVGGTTAAAPPLQAAPAACTAAAPAPVAGMRSDLTAAVPRALPAGRSVAELERLADVGLVVWQSGFVLAEYLLRVAPFGRDCWRDVSAIDLGTGAGVVGIALAMAGAAVVLTDLPHVLPLAARNAVANCSDRPRPPLVLEHRWGDADRAAALRAALADLAAGRPCLPTAAPTAGGTTSLVGGTVDEAGGSGDGSGGTGGTECGTGGSRHVQGGALVPDLITAADCLYEPSLHGVLLDSLGALCAAHTLVFLAYRPRGADEGARFVDAAAGRGGWAVEEVPAGQLHEEYRDGQYHVLRMCRLDPMDES